MNRVGTINKLNTMVSHDEFMEIVKNHLTIRKDGSVYINDPEQMKKYTEYLKQSATKESPVETDSVNFLGICANIIC